MVSSGERATSDSAHEACVVNMKLRSLVSGVVCTSAQTNDRKALEAAARMRLGKGAVLIRWEWDGRDQLFIWWATGRSNVLTLAGCDEMAGGGTDLTVEDDTLVIHTNSPHIWVGRGGWRVRAPQKIWGVRLRVQNAHTVRGLIAASAASAKDRSQPRLGWWQRLVAWLLPSPPAA